MEKWKLLTEHNKCTFCDTGIENILHLFWECEFIKEFWWKLEIWCENKLQVSQFQFEKGGGRSRTLEKLHNYAGKEMYLSIQHNNKQQQQQQQNSLFM